MNILDAGKETIRIEEEALKTVRSRLGESFERAVDEIATCKGRVILTGIGKSGLIARKIAATLSSTGTPSVFIHAADAVHGDLGMIKEEDIIIAISYSGETEEIKRLIYFIKRLGLRVIAITGNVNSTLGRHADITINAEVDREDPPLGVVPTASTTAALAIGDALAVALMVKKGFGKDDFARFHPGGALGKKLLKVKNLMHTEDELPIAKENDPMHKVIGIMSEKGFGTAAVVDSKGKLVGIITDGDLRRALLRFGSIAEMKAGEIMTLNPITIDEDELATKALKIMEDKKITCLLVPDEKGRLKGLLHLHDLWRTELF